MKVLFTATECAPFFKTGGLGDVLGALPKQLAKDGVEVGVALPYFASKLPEQYRKHLEEVACFTVWVGWRKQSCSIWQLKMDGVTYYFVDNPYYFDRANFYDYPDDGERFAFFCQASLHMLEKIDFIPDIVHANDWHTAMIPVLLQKKIQEYSFLSSAKTVFTIHNIIFQGNFPKEIIADVFGLEEKELLDDKLFNEDQGNFLKGAIHSSDLVTTVSPTYAEEIQTEEFGYGLEEDLKEIRHKVTGIVNGIDYDTYNPEEDKSISATFSISDLSGKEQNKAALQERVGLPIDPDKALIGIVTRLDEQKGIDVVVDALEELLNEEAQYVCLGTGKPYFEEVLTEFSERYPEKCQAIIDFDVELAQWIYAGSDLFLMPSKFEPCGLSQLNSLRYGTLPLVHETGGLKDTVLPYKEEDQGATGFSFQGLEKEKLIQAVQRALTVYYDQSDQWKTMMKEAMLTDNSWRHSAGEYLNQYKKLVEKEE